MDRPGTMENERPAVRTWIENRIELPQCCPVSCNPQPGSTISIRYRAAERVLEVGSLKRYIHSFKGGHPDGTRNMETMIQKIAQDSAAALGVEVEVHASLVLVPHQHMEITCMGKPNDFLPRDPSSLLAGADDDPAVRLAPPLVRAEEATRGNL